MNWKQDKYLWCFHAYNIEKTFFKHRKTLKNITFISVIFFSLWNIDFLKCLNVLCAKIYFIFRFLWHFHVWQCFDLQKLQFLNVLATKAIFFQCFNINSWHSSMCNVIFNNFTPKYISHQNLKLICQFKTIFHDSKFELFHRIFIFPVILC